MQGNTDFTIVRSKKGNLLKEERRTGLFLVKDAQNALGLWELQQALRRRKSVNGGSRTGGKKAAPALVLERQQLERSSYKLFEVPCHGKFERGVRR